MKRHKFFGSMLALTLAGSMIAGCGPNLDNNKAGNNQAAGGKEPVKIGLTISLSGGTADMGEAAKDGAELAIKEINDKGGVLGRPLKLVAYDDEVKPEKGLENVKRLIDQDKVIAVLGPANTGVALAELDYIQQSQVMMLVTASAGTPVTQKFASQDKDYVLRVSMPDYAQAPTIIDFLVKTRGYKKVAILHDTTAYGVSGKNDMEKRLREKHGLSPVAIESFNLGVTDLSAQIKKAKDAGAEAIATYALAPELAQIVKAKERANYNAPVVGSWTLSGELFHKLAGDLVNNEVYTVMSVHPAKSDKYKAFAEKMMATYKRNNFAPVAAQSYDGIFMIAKAIESAKSTDPKAIRDAVEGLKDFSGVTGAPAQPFAKGKPEAIDAKQMFIGKWTTGKLEPVPNSTIAD